MGKSMGLMGMVSMVQACAKRYLASGRADRRLGESGAAGSGSPGREATAHFNRIWVRAISPRKQAWSVPGRYCLWW